MKKVKSTLVLLAIIALAVFALTACGNSNGGDGNDASVNSGVSGTDVQLNGYRRINDETIGIMYYISIPNAKMVYPLSDVVTVAENSTWTVSTDISGNKTIASKTLQLDEGDNLYYLQVRDDKSNVKQYVLLIHRKYMYTVTYKSNGSTYSTEAVEEGDYPNPPSITPPTGYTFDGWESDINKPISGNLTINAKFKAKEYKITFDPNGGSLTTKTQTVQYNTYVNYPTPTREGYTFDGWYFNSKRYSSDYYKYDGNLNLTAEWSAKKYTITYNLGGGTNNPDNEFYYYADEPIVLCNPSLAGYEFLGWTYDGMTTPQKNVIIEGAIGNKTFTANWKILRSEGLEYELNGNTYTVTGIGTCADKSIIIPYEYNGKRVTKIGDDAFRGCEGITSVTIPDSVTSIGSYAFFDCDSLTSVTIGNGVTSIGNCAFRYCGSLTSVVIPDSVTSIGDWAFYNCTSLTSVVIPNSVTSIGDWAFYNCTSLTSVVIPDSVTSIGWYAFYDCDSLTIYCEATSKPSGWDSNWNYSKCPVVWGYVIEG